jgi:hypothetical protein
MKIQRPLSEEYLQVAEQWVAHDSAARLLEEGKSAYLSQRMMAQDAPSIAKAEMQVKASEDWSQYIKRMCKARDLANLSKVRMDYIRMRFSEHQSDAATERAASRL